MKFTKDSEVSSWSYSLPYSRENSERDHTNIESKTRSVVKYVINNIMSTALPGRREDGYVLAFRA